MKRERVLIMGAAGRDFHNFNICFRNNPHFRVLAFTAAQIPFIGNRRYPPALAGSLYPRGIPIYDEALLEQLIRKYRIQQVVFAYSDLPHMEVMHKASQALALDADFRLIGPGATMLKSCRPVISVCAVRTGCGKSGVTRYLCGILRDLGKNPVIVRHPMPYGDLTKQAVQRFASMDDLVLHDCTIEEREEYEPLIQQGAIVFAGVDYARVLDAAEREGEVIIWDGGNNDFPFFRSDLEITLVDPLRLGHETAYFPGEVNLRRARVVIINKADAASDDALQILEHSVRAANPTAMICRTVSAIAVDEPACIQGKTVLVVEDGPTITHGGMASGAGFAAGIKYGAVKIVDPRPYAQGSIAEVYRQYPHIGPVLPAMGYSAAQIEELLQTIEATPCDLVLSATPVDLERLMALNKPVTRVRFAIEEQAGTPLRDIVRCFLAGAGGRGGPGEKPLQVD